MTTKHFQSITTKLPTLIFLTFSHVNAFSEGKVANEMLFLYQENASLPFDAERGRKMWFKEGLSKNGKIRLCTTCHGKDITLFGKHAKTGKPIKPMAFSSNSKRLSKVKNIKKWFKRNCKWTWGRECSAQEKGDFLTYFLTY